jgi:chemotaxis protein CheX
MVVQSVSNRLLLEAAQEIFETMVFMSIQATDQASNQIGNDSLLGTITFSGDVEGCFDFRCETACAKAIAAGMLGMESVDELADEDANDAIGEIVNMVMGSIKAADETFANVQVSIPTVIMGKEIAHTLGERAHGMSACVMIADTYPVGLSLLWREHSTEGEGTKWHSLSPKGQDTKH